MTAIFNPFSEAGRLPGFPLILDPSFVLAGRFRSGCSCLTQREANHWVLGKLLLAPRRQVCISELQTSR